MKIIKTNTTPYMGKVLRKVIMSRSAMEKNSYKNRMKPEAYLKHCHITLIELLFQRKLTAKSH